MGKTQKDYEQEYRNEHTGEIEAKAAKRRQVAEEQKTGYNQLVDTATDQAAGKYRQSMDALPGQSQALYDQNAVTEAIGRKQIEERLSNMGHRNAGLSSSMQTALTVQKANADQQVRRQEQEQVTALQTAIDDLYAQSALTKASYAAQVDDQTRTYEDTLWASLDKNASDYAVGAYTADQAYAAKVVAAQIEAEKDAHHYSLTAMEQATKLADMLYEGGNYKSVDAALYDAMKIYGLVDDETATGPETDPAAQATAFFDEAMDYLDKFDFKINGWNAFWGGREKDGHRVGETINKKLSGDATFARYKGEDKGNLLAIAVAKAVAEQWPTEGEVDDNQFRIKAACETLGLGEEYIKFAKKIFAALNPLAGNRLADASTGTTGTANGTTTTGATGTANGTTTTGATSSGTKSTVHPKFLR